MYRTIDMHWHYLRCTLRMSNFALPLLGYVPRVKVMAYKHKHLWLTRTHICASLYARHEWRQCVCICTCLCHPPTTISLGNALFKDISVMKCKMKKKNTNLVQRIVRFYIICVCVFYIFSFWCFYYCCKQTLVRKQQQKIVMGSKNRNFVESPIHTYLRKHANSITHTVGSHKRCTYMYEYINRCVYLWMYLRATHILKIEIAATVGGVVATEISIGNMRHVQEKFAKN